MNFGPFSLMKMFIAERPEVDGDNEPFFIFSDGSPVTPSHARNFLKKVLENLNLDTNLYNCHSFRIGRAVDMQKLGYSISDIQKKGRWLSNAVSPIFPLIISSAKYPPVSSWSNRPSYLRGRQQLFMGVLFVHWALS